MSYCRFSSDNFTSDLYIYATTEGWTIHVAGNRVVGEIPQIDWTSMERDEVNAFVAQSNAQMDFLKTAARAPITCAYAGETLNLPTAAECADKVEELVALGYHCPTGVVEELRGEGNEDAST